MYDTSYFLFQLVTIQNLQGTRVYSDMAYTFPVLLHITYHFQIKTVSLLTVFI
jgi:hypothetical protein